MIDELLKRFNLKYEDLSSIERETLHSWMESLEKNQLNLDLVRQYIASMRDSVEQELTKTGNENKNDIFLKARLRNYMLLEAFLSTPEKAKKALERTMAGVVGTKL